MVLVAKAMEKQSNGIKRSWFRNLPWWRVCLGMVVLIDLVLLISYSFTKHEKSQLKKRDWTLSVTTDGKSCYQQWDSSEAIGPLPAGRLRIDPDSDLSKQWPQLIVSKPRPIQIVKASDFQSSFQWQKDHDAIILYDTWNIGESFDQAITLNQDSSDLQSILLDSSGTMAEPLTKEQTISRYRLAIKKLFSKRQSSFQTWNLYTFANGLVDHGAWERESGLEALAQLPPSGGKTSLLSAVRLWLDKVEKPSTLIVITDGEIDQKDQNSVLQMFRKLRSMGHRLCILSPELQAIERFNFAYESGLVLSSWPKQEERKPIAKTRVKDFQTLEWHRVPRTRSLGNARPVLFSEEGQSLVYLQQLSGSLRYHVVGKPQVPLTELPKWLLKKRTPRLVVELSSDHWKIDLMNEDLRPMSMLIGGEQFWVYANYPGIYTWEKDLRYDDYVSFYHPSVGEFQLSGLSGMKLLEGLDEKEHSVEWSLSGFSSPISNNSRFYFFLLAFVHVLLISLGGWLVYAKPTPKL